MDIVTEVGEILLDYHADNPASTADRLRIYWYQFETKSVGGIKAEERARQETVGTPVPILKKMGGVIAKEAGRQPGEYLPLATILWDEYGREGRVISALILGKIELADPANTLPLLMKLCRSSYTWEDADRLAMDGIEPIVRKHPGKWLAEIEPWLVDENKWVRRAGITVVGRLPMKQPSYTGRCLSYSEQLLTDDEEVVKKAVSFAIRLCARGDVSLVADFLRGHVPPKDSRAAWVLCDVIRSMAPKLRPEFVPLLPKYQQWAANPDLSSRDLRSVESAIRTLQAAVP